MTPITLIIDDDPLTCEIHQKLLAASGITTTPQFFTSGGSALQYLEASFQEHFHYLIFLDLTMPGMSGWEFLENLERTYFTGNIHVIIVSSSDWHHDRVKANTHKHVLKYIVKPLTIDHLLLVEEFIRNNQIIPLE